MNLKLETKFGGQIEDSVLAKAVIIKNHRKLHDYKKEIFEKMVDDVKATGSHIMPRFRGPAVPIFSLLGSWILETAAGSSAPPDSSGR